MKKSLLTIVAIALALSGLAGTATAQNECDTLYIKAMQANVPAERAKLLKDFLATCAGKGNQLRRFPPKRGPLPRRVMICLPVAVKTEMTELKRMVGDGKIFAPHTNARKI